MMAVYGAVDGVDVEGGADIEARVRRLAEVLLRSKSRLVVAESCTGGSMAGALTALEGCSAWFERGFVAYSNAAKEEQLGVSRALMVEHGAVSEPVVRAMAMGALSGSDADLAVAASGISGPGGGSAEKPVGAVCVAWARRLRAEALVPEIARVGTE